MNVAAQEQPKVSVRIRKTFQDLDTEGFVRAIAVALKAEFGATPSALKKSLS